MKTKICSKCRKELTIDKFNKHKANKDGLNSYCKECAKECSKQYRKDHKEIMAKQSKQWYERTKEATREKRIENAKNYRKNNKEKIKKLHDIYYAANAAKILEYGKQYREANPEKVIETAKEYYKTHKGKIQKYAKQHRKESLVKNNEAHKQWKLKNPDKFKKMQTNYRKENPDKFNMYEQKRRARKCQLLSTLTLEQWEQIKQSFNNKCAYCGKELPLAQEHFIPLSKGGEYTFNNIIPSCQSCNSSKGTKSFEVWYPKYRYYSKKREKNILEFLNYHNNIQQLSIL